MDEIERLRAHVAREVGAMRRDVARLFLVGFLGSVLVTAGICLGTLLLLL